MLIQVVPASVDFIKIAGPSILPHAYTTLVFFTTQIPHNPLGFGAGMLVTLSQFEPPFVVFNRAACPKVESYTPIKPVNESTKPTHLSQLLPTGENSCCQFMPPSVVL